MSLAKWSAISVRMDLYQEFMSKAKKAGFGTVEHPTSEYVKWLLENSKTTVAVGHSGHHKPHSDRARRPSSSPGDLGKLTPEQEKEHREFVKATEDVRRRRVSGGVS